MLKTAEAVSIGHPDKTADYISSYILDRLIEQDPGIHYAVEVMIKDNCVMLGGEVKGSVDMSDIETYVCDALREIGYDEHYSDIWKNYAIDVRHIEVINKIGVQSADINQGVEHDGWGDQGVFVGYACKGPALINRELWLARKLNDALYEHAKTSSNLGLDIKTQITIDDATGDIVTAIVAIPMLEPEDIKPFVVDARTRAKVHHREWHRHLSIPFIHCRLWYYRSEIGVRLLLYRLSDWWRLAMDQGPEQG